MIEDYLFYYLKNRKGMETNENGEVVGKSNVPKSYWVFLASAINFILSLIISLFHIFKEFSQNYYIISTTIFLVFSCYILYIVKKDKKTKFEESIEQYQKDMLFLEGKFIEININSDAKFDFILKRIDEELNNRKQKSERIYKGMAKFMVVIALPLIALVFNSTLSILKFPEIEIANLNEQAMNELISIAGQSIGILILAIFEAFMIYMSFIILIDIKSVKTLRLESMREDLTWIKTKLSGS